MAYNLKIIALQFVWMVLSLQIGLSKNELCCCVMQSGRSGDMIACKEAGHSWDHPTYAHQAVCCKWSPGARCSEGSSNPYRNNPPGETAAESAKHWCYVRKGTTYVDPYANGPKQKEFCCCYVKNQWSDENDCKHAGHKWHARDSLCCMRSEDACPVESNNEAEGSQHSNLNYGDADRCYDEGTTYVEPVNPYASDARWNNLASMTVDDTDYSQSLTQSSANYSSQAAMEKWDTREANENEEDSNAHWGISPDVQED